MTGPIASTTVEAILTQAMARALAEEVHLDERYVAERLRDAVEGMPVSSKLLWVLAFVLHTLLGY